MKKDENFRGEFNSSQARVEKERTQETDSYRERMDRKTMERERESERKRERKRKRKRKREKEREISDRILECMLRMVVWLK